MQIYPTIIKNALHCSDAQALEVEKYMSKGNMIAWSDASKQLITTIARAVNDKLLRDAAVSMSPRTTTITSYSGKQVEVGLAPAPTKTKAPKAGTKIAHAIEIYKAMEVDGVRASRQDIISALANSMQIEKKAAAGYYQNCKKKVG